MKRTLLLVGSFAFFHVCLWSQTNEFTYQGNLKIGPSPAIASATTVNYDFDFRLCTTDTGNCSMAPGLIGIVQHPNVPVTDGIFTVKLNFTAANAFDGSPRWLQIAIKPAGDPGGYLVLLPRQQLTSTPYAIRSKNSEQLGGIAASQYLQTNGNGSSLTNLNAGNITTGTLAIANGGTGSSTKNFVDLSTDQNSIGGNKTFAGNLFVNGNLGIGTSSPAGKFHINVPGSGNPISALTVDVGTFGTGTNASNSYYFKAQDLGAPGTPAFLIRGDGNVGIGTGTPAATLEVNGYTKLGSDAPAIRVKKITGTTSESQGGSAVINTGLDPSKILSISVMVTAGNNLWYPPFTGSTTSFLWTQNSSFIEVVNVNGSSANILSKPFKIVIIYEQ